MNSKVNLKYISSIFLIIFLISFFYFNSFAFTDIGPPPIENPTVISVTPDNGINASTTNITITGTNFTYAATAKIGTVDLTGIVVNNTTSLTTTVPAGLTPGIYDISVINPGNKIGTLTDGFKVKQKPTAYIDSITPNPADLGSLITFIGHGDDAGGTIISYNWRSSINGYLSYKSSFSKSTLSAGVHAIYFKAQDDDGLWSDEVSVILKVNKKPTATIDSITPNPANRNQIVNFTGSGIDTDGTITEYLWNFGDSSTSTSQNPNHTYTNPGTYTVSFKVKDNDGSWSSETTTTVTIVNQTPTANAGVDQTVNEGAIVNLNGSASSDPDGDILSYNWTQTVGPAVTLSNPNTADPSFTAPEVTTDTTLTFELTVSDGKGGTSKDTVNITVNTILNLHKGWNLITFPNLIPLPIYPPTLRTAQSLLDLINSQGGDATQIVKWNPETQSWIIHINNVPINNFEIKPGEGYFVKSNKNSEFTLTGTSINSPVPISFFKNWNLIGIPYPANKYTAQTLLDEINKQGGGATLIVRWDPIVQSWITHINKVPINDFEIKLGEGYFIKTGKASEFVP